MIVENWLLPNTETKQRLRDKSHAVGLLCRSRWDNREDLPRAIFDIGYLTGVIFSLERLQNRERCTGLKIWPKFLR